MVGATKSKHYVMSNYYVTDDVANAIFGTDFNYICCVM